MTGAPDDLDGIAAGDPRTPPQQLADIAARRWDLHATIAAHPQLYPALRDWMEQVNPAASQPPYMRMPTTSALPPQRRSRRGWWIGGCGCLAIIVIPIVILAVLGALGGMTSSDPGTDSDGSPHASNDQIVQEQLAIYESERAKYYELAEQLEGNPVAPLVTQSRSFHLLEKRAGAAQINRFQAEDLAEGAQQFRQALQQRIADAAKRRGNSSGSVTEDLVDSAGDGYIDIGWDASSACASSENSDRETAGCVSESPLGIHILPESSLFGDWGRRIVVLHELAHLYQRADLDGRGDAESGEAEKLVDRGLFQGSSEKMADCYALTYLDEWSLSNDQGTLGYGYVCNASERQAIREWAASIHAPIPN